MWRCGGYKEGIKVWRPHRSYLHSHRHHSAAECPIGPHECSRGRRARRRVLLRRRTSSSPSTAREPLLALLIFTTIPAPASTCSPPPAPLHALHCLCSSPAVPHSLTPSLSYRCPGRLPSVTIALRLGGPCQQNLASCCGARSRFQIRFFSGEPWRESG